MARTLLSALAVIALLACGGDAKKHASHSRTHAAGSAATRPSATHKTPAARSHSATTPRTSSRTKSSARRTTARRDTTQKNPLTNRP